METIHNALNRLISTDRSIELLNYYKSYPVPIQGEIFSFSSGILTVIVSPPISVCLYQNKATILISQNLQDAIHAKVLHFDIDEGKVNLCNLSFMGSWIGRRMLVRVQPAQNMPVLLERDNLVLRGTVADISLNGAGILVTNPLVKPGDEFSITIDLPNGDLSVKGKVVDITPLNNIVRLSMMFLPTGTDIALVLKYLTSRRAELHKEVQALYSKVRVPIRN
jgi:hypothetical protein